MENGISYKQEYCMNIVMKNYNKTCLIYEIGKYIFISDRFVSF